MTSSSLVGVQDDNDPFLVDAGLSSGNFYRTKRAIVRLQQRDMELKGRIRELRIENQKLKEKLVRLKERAAETDKLEARFEQLSTIIMESRMMQSTNTTISTDH